MLQSERRSFLRFLGIYLSSTFLLFFLAVSIFYFFQKHQIIDRQYDQLSMEGEHIVHEFQKLHSRFTPRLPYPSRAPFLSSIYDLDRHYIFGSLPDQHILWEREYYQQGDQLFFVKSIYPYYLGAAYLIVSRPLDHKPLDDLFWMSLFFLLGAGVIFALLGISLGRLFIAPMKESMGRMNKFIEDTTHELNTPISTILTNIELLDTLYDCEGKQEMRRIEIASKTLSRLYEDLTYLKLNHNYHREIVSLNMGQLLYERLEYFNTLITTKQLKLQLDIDPDVILLMDRNDAIRLIDNLLSNAIKYNQKKGILRLSLDEVGLLVYNQGLGIKEDEIAFIQSRFNRANASEGGFGIGLDIVGQVIERYGFSFEIDSLYQHYTEVIIRWEK